MKEVFTRTYQAEASTCDPFQKMRLSAIAERMQACTIAHTIELGYPREMTLDRGLLWVVAQQHIQIHRMPVYDETFVIETWAGKNMHVLFPRYTRVLVKDEVIMEASALWVLMDIHSRQMIFPSKYGIAIDGREEKDIPLPHTVPGCEMDHPVSLTIPYSFCDLNGHLNNARCFDVGEDLLKEPCKGKEIREADIDYVHEIPLHQTITLSHQKRDREYITGRLDGETAFRLALAFEP